MVVCERSSARQAQGGAAEVGVHVSRQFVLFLAVQTRRLEQERERSLLFIDEILDEVLRSIVGLAVDARILDARKVALHTRFEQALELFDGLLCGVLLLRGTGVSSCPLPPHPELLLDPSYRRRIVVGVVIGCFPPFIAQERIQFRGRSHPVGVRLARPHLDAQPLTVASPGDQPLVGPDV